MIGLTTAMNWKSNGITEFITEAMDQVKIVSDIVHTMKDNLRGVQERIAEYNKPLLARKNKPVVKEEFEREHKVWLRTIVFDWFGSLRFSFLDSDDVCQELTMNAL
jgi:hypothetical protein